MALRRMLAGGMTDTAASQFFAGMRRALPVILSAGPFGALFGALAVKNGFTVGEAVLMSATVFAGASQMVGLELFGQNLPAWVVVASIFAVNFRHVLYSAAIGRHFAFGAEWKRLFAFHLLTDPQFAESEAIVQSGQKLSFAWYLGMGLPLWASWPLLAWAGGTFGRLIEHPERFGIDFLLPMYFLGMLVGFRKRPLWLPVVAVSAAASIAAWFTIGSPWHVTAGAFAGVFMAAAIARPEGAS